jgi:hypothetical protein
MRMLPFLENVKGDQTCSNNFVQNDTTERKDESSMANYLHGIATLYALNKYAICVGCYRDR